MTTITAAVKATLARRDADAAAREEQREAIALHVLKPDRWSEDDIILGYPEDVAADIRATPLDATPLADELAALRAEVARLAPFERAASYWKDNHDREKNAHAGTAASHAALRADLAHALGVRDAAMEAEDKAEAERDALRAQRDALQATLCDLSAAFDKRGAQRDAAVEALLSRCPYHDEGEDGLPPHTQNKGDRDKTYPCDLSEMELAALLLARGTP